MYLRDVLKMIVNTDDVLSALHYVKPVVVLNKYDEKTGGYTIENFKRIIKVHQDTIIVIDSDILDYDVEERNKSMFEFIKEWIENYEYSLNYVMEIKSNGIVLYDIERMEELIQEKGIQAPKTGLICIENTNNLNAGMVVPLENINEVCELGKKHNIPVYMDGARIFNAAEATNTDLKEIVKNVDAVMFALTKGLAAPFGAVLLGKKEFIEKARWFKQRIGGGYRQAGFIAAPGIVGLKKMRERISEDHENAQILGKGLADIEGLKVDVSKIHTSITTGSVEDLNITIEEFLDKLLNRNIKAKRISKNSFRMITHWGIDKDDVEYVINSIKEIIEELN